MRRDGGSVFPARANTGDPNGPVGGLSANEIARALISMMARSTTCSNQRPDTLMQDRTSAHSTKSSCNARPDHTLGHVWTAPPWQELSDLLQHWSGAVMCPACLCGGEAAGHNALRGSGPNQKLAFKMR